MSDILRDVSFKHCYKPVRQSEHHVNIGVNGSGFYLGVRNPDVLRAIRVGFGFEVYQTPDYVIIDRKTGTGGSTPISFFTNPNHDAFGFLSEENLEKLSLYAKEKKFHCPSPISKFDLARCFDGFDARIQSMRDIQANNHERRALESRLWKPL